MTAIITSVLVGFIIAQEGYKSLAYADVRGKLTIGCGTTMPGGHPVRPGQRCTEAEAKAWLAADLQTAAQAVDRVCAKVMLTEGQRDALCSFCFNVGCAAFEHSTLAKLVNAGRMNEAAQQFMAWDEAAGHVVEGLVNRRKAERKLFLS